jgi:rhodanese-related sulfurtransferase
MSQLDKGATTILYCRSGGRSAQAAAFFAANGFVDIYNLQGGIIAWVNAGFPVES